MKRGRKSAAALSVVSPIAAARPAPPERLNNEQSQVWRDTVERLPGDWFPVETRHVLEAYCRHVVTGRLISAEIERIEANPEWLKDDDGVKRLDRLTHIRDRETKAAVACGRSLRITKSSQTRPETAYRGAQDAGSGQRPWEC